MKSHREAAAEEPAAPVELSPIERLLWEWFEDNFRGSAVARNTDAWNCVHAAMSDLVRRLKGNR